MADDILVDALEQYSLARDYMRDNMRMAKEDLEFKIGDQWTEQAKADRMKGKVQTRPMYTVNKVPQFIKQVVNEWRQTSPGIRVNPVDGGDRVVADVYEGLVRNIETVSGGEVIYDDCLEQAVDGGFGYFRIVNEFVDDESFDQHLKIKRIRDRFSVTIDHNAQEWTREDAMYAFIETTMSKDVFTRLYPKASTDGFWSDEHNPDWISQNQAKVAEYYLKVPVTKRLALFDDGSIEALPKGKEREFIEARRETSGAQLVRERTVKTHKVKWRKITASEILDEKDSPGIYIPIVPCWGDVTNIEGKDHISGVARYMKDANRIINYAWSTAVEALADAPRNPVMVEKDQIKDFQDMWQRWKTENYQYLVYKQSPNGQGPRRLESQNTASQLLQVAAVATQELHDTSGQNLASLGKPSNETSGIAIAQRAQQGQLSTFNYGDNMNRAISHAGRILVDMIPRIYDSSRVIRILGTDGQPQAVGINGAMTQEQREQGGRTIDLNQGRYDVVVESGPAFATRRQEAVDTMVKLMQADPQAVPLYRPILLKNLDIEGAQDALDQLNAQGGGTDTAGVGDPMALMGGEGGGQF